MLDTVGTHVSLDAPPIVRRRWRRLVSPLLRRILLVNALPLALLVVKSVPPAESL